MRTKKMNISENGKVKNSIRKIDFFALVFSIYIGIFVSDAPHTPGKMKNKAQ